MTEAKRNGTELLSGVITEKEKNHLVDLIDAIDSFNIDKLGEVIGEGTKDKL